MPYITTDVYKYLTPKELAHLLFLRWLIKTGRVSEY